MNSESAEHMAQCARHFKEMTGLSDLDFPPILEGASTFKFPAEKLVSAQGSKSELFILVISGSIRVQFVMESGREVILYNVLPGHGCILTTSCLISGDPFPAEGVTNSDCEVLALTRTAFDRAMDESADFRRFVFSNLGQRLADVISRIEQVRSPSIKRHLAERLIELSDEQGTAIGRTHQELAGDIGTVREVVSRHLKRFETSGWVELGRGNIQIKDKRALARMSERR